MTGKIVLIVAGIVIIGVVIFALVSRQTAIAAAATGAKAVDPITGAPWQTVEDARAQADALGQTQTTTTLVGA